MVPLYDVKCERCERESEEYSKFEDREDIRCGACGGPTEIQITSLRFNRGFVWEPQWHEHLDKDPVYIKSKQHLKDECKKRGVWAPCLD